jgi:hypothetical protein
VEGTEFHLKAPCDYDDTTVIGTGVVCDVGDMASPEKLDGDLGRNLFDRSVNFLRRIGQPVCVDIDAYAAARTGHVLIRSQALDCLSKIVPATWALESDFVQIHASHANTFGLGARNRVSWQTSVTPTFAAVMRGGRAQQYQWQVPWSLSTTYDSKIYVFVKYI